MSLVSPVLSLGGCRPRANGSHRAIYDVPGSPELIVKVMLGHTENTPRNIVKALKYRVRNRWIPRLRYRFLYREYKSYIDIKLSQHQYDEPPPVAELRGIIQTDIGLGMLFEKVVDRPGGLARTVSSVWRAGIESHHVDLLNDFVHKLFHWNIKVNDLNADNIVLGHRDGQDCIVIVDGLGDSHLIPVRSWFRSLNHRSLSKRLASMADRLGLVWHADRRQFSRASRVNRYSKISKVQRPYSSKPIGKQQES